MARYNSVMTTRTIALLCPLLWAGPLPAADVTTPSPETVIEERFWGQLHAEGGKTFFCDTPFTSKGFLITQGYVYPLSHVRTALRCGTPRQCEKDERYRRIASDLHNMVPVQSRVEMRRRNTKYEQLTESTPVGECEIRESTQFIEPPGRIKGDVARIVAYMVDTYHLPWLGTAVTFQSWNELDPPDDTELTRHRRIRDLQGNTNRFVTSPEQMAHL